MYCLGECPLVGAFFCTRISHHHRWCQNLHVPDASFNTYYSPYISCFTSMEAARRQLPYPYLIPVYIIRWEYCCFCNCILFFVPHNRMINRIYVSMNKIDCCILLQKYSFKQKNAYRNLLICNKVMFYVSASYEQF